MNSEKLLKMKYKGKLYSLLCLVEDENKQKQVIDLLSRYEQKIPDSKIKDALQKMLRKNKKYDSLCDSYVNDLLDNRLDANTRNILANLLEELRSIVENDSKNWWDTFIDWFKNATGTN